ncbi:MAG: hypothetical protein GY788_10100 [bacterium]|nr:hypothetical protein [bacterium]
MKLVSCLLIVGFLAAGCRGSFGYSGGQFETLAEDVAAQRPEMESVLDEALGAYDLVGISVSILPCEPLSEWSSGTRLVVRPSVGDTAGGIAAIVEVLEARGIKIETYDPFLDRQESDSYGGDYPGFEGFSLWRGSEPEAGIVFDLGSGCYPEGRTGADSPHDLSFEEGFVNLVQD